METSYSVLITLFCMHKTTGEVWYPWRHVILVQKSLFCMQKPQVGSGHIETSNSGPNHDALHAQNDR